MIRKLGILTAVISMLLLTVAVTTAGSPHFVGACVKGQSGNTITATCKEAGLGDEAQINVTLTADASCINPGDKHPKAANKASVAAGATVPVQNGKADYTLTGTATFQPDCSPPMTVVFSNVTVTDTTNGISVDP
jgi:hypothetical protein